MPSINISEEDFVHVAGAAKNALDDGDEEAAKALDKIARKINAALTNGKMASYLKHAGVPRTPITWEEVPSTLDP